MHPRLIVTACALSPQLGWHTCQVQLPHEADGFVEPLTPRELDLVALLLDGVTTNRELAERMVVTDNTVHFHMASVLRKLGCSDRTQVVIRASRLDTVAYGGGNH